MADAFLETHPSYQSAREALIAACDNTYTALIPALTSRAQCRRTFEAIRGEANEERSQSKQESDAAEAAIEQAVRNGRKQIRIALGMPPDFGSGYDALADPALAVMKKIIHHAISDVRTTHGVHVTVLPCYWGKAAPKGNDMLSRA